MFKEARLQAKVAMNEGRDQMFNDAIIGPQRQPNLSTQLPIQTAEKEPNQEVEMKPESMEVQNEEPKATEEQQNANKTG